MEATRLRRFALVSAAFVVGGVLLSCGSSSSSAGQQTRTVLVDYDNDEFEVSSLEYYPKKLAIRPGDTVAFQQKWNGEPHSVTMGSLVDDSIKPLIDLFEEVLRTGELPPEEPEEFETFGEVLPFAFGEEALAQNAAQPCFVDEAGFGGTYPGDETTPCPKREQPEFGNDSVIYSSGIIPFEGVKGNTFTVKLADDLEPGTYTYYCNVHGPLQYGKLEVQPKGSDIPSTREVAEQARDEAERNIEPVAKAYAKALKGGTLRGGEEGDIKIESKGKNLTGVPTPFFVDGRFVHTFAAEFVPKEIRAKVGKKVSWTFISGHTLSFNVPRYFPVFTVGKNGKVTLNPKAEDPVGGWPDRPRPEGEEGEGGEEGGEDTAPPDEAAAEEGGEGPPEEGGGGPPEPVNVDVGEWDGRGFKSTGLSYEDLDTFSVTFTKAGNYTFACLIHPKMVGKVVVRS